MADILSYAFVTPYSVCVSEIEDRIGGTTPLQAWLLNGQIAEHLEVSPTNNTQTFTATSKDKYLASVTVDGKVPKTFELTVSVSSVGTVDLPGAVVVESDSETIATAAASGLAVSVTGVAAGTTCVRVYNAGKTLIGIIVVNVVATS